MTYTVIGRCSRTGEVGIGVATYSLACGSFTQGAHGGFGIAMTQANVRKANATLAGHLLAQGHSSRSVLDSLVRDDTYEAMRQIAVMTRDGRAVARTGSQVAGWAGERYGPGFVVFGNVLAGSHVLEAMHSGFSEQPNAPLVERLIQSLEHGRDSGGQASGGVAMPERSACVVVMSNKPQAAWDLRVDLHPRAVDELRRLYLAFAHYQPYYENRDEDPSQCLSQLAWERKHLTEDQLQEFMK